MDDRITHPEETLDPADWQSMRSLAHRMVDDVIDYLKDVRDRPVWQPVPEDVQASFHSPVPLQPQEPQAIYEEFLEKVFPYPMGNIHPRFWGWVMGNGTILGVLAEMLASTMNPNLVGGNHVGAYVETQVIDWLKEIMGFPADASGILVSGGSMANLVGLAVARNVQAGFDVRKEGVAAGSPMIIYGSVEMHSSVQKAVELMGLGSTHLRKIPVDSQYRIDLAELESAIQEDRRAGNHPICIVGSAGTVNTGAIDDLQSLADLCQREGLWYHVDGAFGAFVRLSPELHSMVAGLERADSLSFDLHKWMYLPFEAGCVLVRHPREHFLTFSLTPDYLVHVGERGLASGARWYSDYGFQLSRNFRALKAWMSIKEHGIEKYGRMVQQNMAQARYLAERVEREPELELLAPVPLNIVCFRYRAEGLDEKALNTLNQELLIRLYECGSAAPSYTTLDGCYALRAAITNHRSRREDFDLLADEVIRLGHELVGEQGGGGKG